MKTEIELDLVGKKGSSLANPEDDSARYNRILKKNVDLPFVPTIGMRIQTDHVTCGPPDWLDAWSVEGVLWDLETSTLHVLLADDDLPNKFIDDIVKLLAKMGWEIIV